MSNEAILTEDNMLKRKWTSSPECYFCDCNESTEHLFFKCSMAKIVWACLAKCLGATDILGNLVQCWSWLEKWLPQGKKFHVWGITAICWAIWKARNRVCFDNKFIKSPVEIICHAGAVMKFWAGLYAEMDMKEMEEGVNTMLKVAMDILATKESKVTLKNCRRIWMMASTRSEKGCVKALFFYCFWLLFCRSVVARLLFASSG